MSKTENEVDLNKYRSTQGVSTKTGNVSGNEHAVKKRFGSDASTKTFEFDAEIIAERIADWYDDDAATIREYLSNAETACIRRARMELRGADASTPEEIEALFDKAYEVTGYEPLIEVTYNRQPESTRLSIEDNGCGITTDEYQVLRNIGYSASHDSGGRLGQFGMGILSGFQLVGTHGAIKFSTHSFPEPGRSEDAYSMLMYVTNLEYLDGEPQDYGTRFEFPAFGEAAKEIPIAEKVAEFAEGMRVPVLYRDFDSSGEETGKSDDFLPRNIEEDYADDSMVVTYEDEFFKAVMSPDNPEGRRSGELVTYNVTMPIRRNLDTWDSTDSFEAPWKWDFRGKREDGPIVKCEEDPSLEGKVPIENTKYDALMDHQRDDHVPMSKVPDDAIVMPGPASSRDSYMSGHDTFWKYVSEKLNEAWAEIAKERFASLDSWDTFEDLPRDEKNALFRAYEQFGPKYGSNEPDNIQETLNDAFGVMVPLAVCERIDKSRKSLMVVPQGHSQAHHKKPAKRNKKKIWQIIDEAPDGVYMGKTISQKKAEIAWGLGDTHVLRIEDKDYDELEDLWGFQKLKDLPHTNLKEKLPELDDDVADRWENKKTSSSRSSGGSRRTSRDPTSKRIKVRVGTHNSRYFSNRKVEYIVDKLQNDQTFRAGRYDCSRLVIRCTADDRGNYSWSKKKGIAGAKVPKYVFEYLKDIDGVYTKYQNAVDDVKEEELEEWDEGDIIVFAGSSIVDAYAGRHDELIEALNEHEGTDFDPDCDITVHEYSKAGSIGFVTNDDFDATVIGINDGWKSRDVREASYSLSLVDIKFAKEAPEMDFDSPYFKQVFGQKKHLRANSNTMDRGLKLWKELGREWPDA